MNRRITGLVFAFVCVTSTAGAQSLQSLIDGVPAEEAEHAAQVRQSLIPRTAPPGAQAEADRQERLMRERGYLDASDEEVRPTIDTARLVGAQHPAVSDWPTVAKKALIPPTDISKTRLAGATFEGVWDSVPQGVGMYTRSFRLPDGRGVELAELDYAALGDSPHPVANHANAQVGAWPAIYRVYVSPSYMITKVSWETPSKAYFLAVMTDGRDAQVREDVLGLAREISEAGATLP